MKNLLAVPLVGILATAFAPEVSALPAFARQTGMECNSCHQQHFPVLNSFGRSFKASGYTMSGAQGKVEGKHLSIPDTLNAAILLKIRYQKDNTNGAYAATGLTNAGDGQLQFGDESGLFFGGRIAENVGFIVEGSMGNHAVNNAGSGGLLSGIRLPILFDVGFAKMSVIPFSTDMLGVSYGFELSSAGVMRANRWAEHRRETSAYQYNADRGPDGGAANGFAFVVQNDLGFANYSMWAPNHLMGGNGGGMNATKMNSSYFRVAATPTVGDWAMVIGAQSIGGTSWTRINQPNGVIALPIQIVTRQTGFDLQAHGKVGENALGIYATYANAPSDALLANAYNGTIGGAERRSFVIGADYSVIPSKLHLGAAYRNAKNGNLTNNGDNAVTLTAVYDLLQNMAFHANYSAYSGSSRNVFGAQKNLLTLMLESSW